SAVDGHPHENRQCCGRNFVGDDVRAGGNRLGQKPVQGNRRRTIAGTGRGPASGPGAARPAPSRVDFSGSGGQGRVSGAVSRGGLWRRRISRKRENSAGKERKELSAAQPEPKGPG